MSHQGSSLIAQTGRDQAVTVNGKTYGPFRGGFFEGSKSVKVFDEGEVYRVQYVHDGVTEWEARLPKETTTVSQERVPL